MAEPKGGYPVRTVAMLLILLVAAGVTQAATYYVDFEKGADTNHGTDMKTPWKHCPGDPRAVAVAAGVELAPGDVVRFKGGVVYRGMIDVRASGVEGKPIVYDGNTDGNWGTGRAVIDGSEPVAGWRKCTGPEDADNNPHWRKLHYTWLPGDADVLTLNLCDGPTMLYLAQSTNPPTPFRMDDPELLWNVAGSGVHDQEQLTDGERLAGKPVDAFDDAFMYLCAIPMRMATAKIEAYDPARGQVGYEKIKLRTYPDARYAILNAAWAIDRPGEYVLKRQADVRGRRKLLLWPPKAESLRAITRSVRDTGFDFNRCGHVTVRGFAIRKLAPQRGRIHRGAFSKRQRGGGNEGGNGLSVRGNEISLLWKTPAMYLSILQRSRVEDNHVHDCALGGTILLNKFDDSVCKNNRLERIGTTGIDFYRCHRSRMIGNQVSDVYGVHANGLTIYLQSSHILVAYNRVLRGNVAMTLQRSSHITLAYNVFHSARTPAVADWDGLDHLAFYNNTVIGGTTGLTTGKNSKNITLRNNLIWPTSAAERSEGPFDISHNLYGKMPWPKKGKELHAGEMIVGEKEKLFRNFDEQDFRPPKWFPGKDKGVSIPRGILDLAVDVAGNPLPVEGVDIGAYQE